MDHPVAEISPEELARRAAYVGEALRRWRLDPDWIDAEPTGPSSEESNDEEAVRSDPLAVLRRRRQLESVRILWRDVTGRAMIEETGRALSALAAECLETALAAAEREVGVYAGALVDPDGRPIRLGILGLGKLGGDELNFNSDLDLVFVHGAGARAGEIESAGPRRIPAREYLGRVARKLIELMEAVTEHGRAWVIDTRLRPYGQAGALVWSTGAMEQYFLTEGRAWERYAWLKARPVAGDLDTGARLIEQLRPFIFRRYLDYGLFESLRKLHAEIDRKGRMEDFEHDIKRGPGGIRELEFLVQSVQLIRGGRDEELQAPGFLPALRTATRLGLMGADEARVLADDYGFLRVLENRLQAVTGRQTQQIPGSKQAREDLACLMGQPDWASLEGRIGEVRGRVGRSFRTRFEEPPAEESGEGGLWPGAGEKADAAALKACGFEDPEAAAAALDRLLERVERRPLTAEARRRLDRLMPGLLAEVVEHRPPDAGFEQLLALIETVARRSAYLALLHERPQTLKRLVQVFRRSERVAGWVVTSPHLIDDLLDPVNRFGLPAPPRMNPGDPEASLEALGRFRQAGFLRTALGQLDDSLDQPGARAQLTRLAEQVLAAGLELACPGQPAEQAPLAVIGYGNLGAGELHYTSDLDLVFLHADGEAPLRPAQRLISFMQLPLTGGKLYEIDTRLRPNGNAGLLVSTLKSFDDYQRRHAWTWEHQALIRARFVAGAASLEAPFEQTRREVLCREREEGETLEALVRMRRRQRRERREDPVKALMTDIQFIAEAGVLLKSCEVPELAGHRRTDDQLRALAGCRWLDEATAGNLIGALDRAATIRDANYLERSGELELPPELAEPLPELWRRVFGQAA